MADEKYIDQGTILGCSSIIENAPQVIEVGITRYTGLYALKCASCQSQNCAGPRIGIEKKV